MRLARPLSAVLALVLAAGVVSISGERLERLDAARFDAEELLYLPSGRHLKLMSLGHDALVADWVYLWAIQYYSNYGRGDRYRYVEHVFGDVITELDPHYIDAYWLGALILIVEAGDLDAGLRLLEKGMRHNEDEWILPYLAAWECYHAGRLERAASYFARARAIPGAPPVVRRMQAGMVARAGDADRAIAMWLAIRDDPASDPASVAIARRQVGEMTARRDLAGLSVAIARFRDDNGRWPRRLEELVQRDYIDALPIGADGRPYGYDARTGKVASSAGRVLGDS